MPIVNFKVGVSLSGSFIYSHSTTLVSAIYYTAASSELIQPATIEIEHCVYTGNSDGLTFGRADTGNYWTTPPYHFKSLPGGIFKSGQSWGVINVSSFSIFGVLGLGFSIFGSDGMIKPLEHTVIMKGINKQYFEITIDPQLKGVTTVYYVISHIVS